METAEYRKWRHRRMSAEGWLCRPCRERGLVVAAEQLDHEPPRSKSKAATARERVMVDGGVQPICVPCHRTKSMREEAARHPHLRDPVTVDPRFVD